MSTSLEFYRFMDTVDQQAIDELVFSRDVLVRWVDNQYSAPARTGRELAEGLAGMAEAVDTIVNIGGEEDGVNGFVVRSGDIVATPQVVDRMIRVPIAIGGTELVAWPHRERLIRADEQGPEESEYLVPSLSVTSGAVLMTDVELPTDAMIDAYGTGSDVSEGLEDISALVRRHRNYDEIRPFALDTHTERSEKQAVEVYTRHLSRLTRILLWAVPDEDFIDRRRKIVEDSMRSHISA